MFERDGAAIGKLLDVFEGKPGWELGSSISQMADFDGDGVRELAVGAPGVNKEAGMVFLLSEKGELLPTELSGTPKARMGSTVVRLGDLNGDGFSELGVTMPNLHRAQAFFPGSYAVFTRFGPKTKP